MKPSGGYIELIATKLIAAGGDSVLLGCTEGNRVGLAIDYLGHSATGAPSITIQWQLNSATTLALAGIDFLSPYLTALAITPEIHSFPAPGNNTHERYVLEFVAPPGAGFFTAKITETGDGANPGTITVWGAVAGGT
jgi:hypothetical protein